MTVPSGPGPKLTPVMQQYLEIKQQHEDALLFFRLGDFYEMFFEDAVRAASILDITLTSRNRNDENPIPMCGVPYHSARPYIARLLEAGVKVAVCEQIELPAKGIARREVARVITPGTSLDEESLVPERGNYIASVCEAPGAWGVAWADFSTGDVRVTDVATFEAVEEELAALGPSEILATAEAVDALRARLAGILPGCMITVDGGGHDAAGGDLRPAPRAALGALLGYLERTQGGRTAHLREPIAYESGSFLGLDRATRRNLELVETADGGRKGSLLDVVDRAATPMGKRMLREWLLRPLADLGAIGSRLDAVELYVENFDLRADVREIAARVGDLERLAGRLGSATAGPRDLVRLVASLEAIEALAERLGRLELPPLLVRAAAGLDGLPELRQLVARSLVDEPPLAPGRGPLIRARYHDEVDRLRSVSTDGKGWMTGFETAERKRTGIGNLRIGYNKVFGYYIEVSRAAQDRVPADYERKQTLTNAERYVTGELKRREAEVLGAEERLTSLETHLLGEILATAAGCLPSLTRSATSVAVIDALAGLAETAHRNNHVRPAMHDDGVLEIVEGRHPVVEDAIGSRFVPNDCRLDPDCDLVVVITGPNMAGKSTYLRQVALIALMAHCGAFVPATTARVPLLDRIFTRIGASDDLRRGQSTFMVEMTETAAILKAATDRSLVVLDEIGRGTSTFDGISIAWAVAEAMVAGRVKTLFATHYHELAGLAAEHARVANASVAVRRYKGEVLFLYRVVPGAASGSYGIEVARLAGVPPVVIEKARQMLAKFESEPGPTPAGEEIQPSLFSAAAPKIGSGVGRPDERADPLAAIDVESLTPLEALNLLDRLVRDARNRQ